LDTSAKVRLERGGKEKEVFKEKRLSPQDKKRGERNKRLVTCPTELASLGIGREAKGQGTISREA